MIHSFLLIGQSNMAGRGFICDAPAFDDGKVLVLRNGRWQKAFRPICPDRAFSGVNLAEYFASAYAAEHGVYCGLIPCADGGTSLNQWKEGSLLYDNAVNCARLAMRTSTVAGVLWHQGETDCMEGSFDDYEEKLSKIFAALRRDLSLFDVPFVVGGLGDYLVNREEPGLKKYAVINKALKSYASSSPMTGFVSAERLTSNPDNLHFDSASLYEFGKRYYEVFKTLEDKNKVFSEKPDMDFCMRGALEKY